jgi:hypothetical protein
VERRFVGICWPQNLQRALPGEMWMRCIASPAWVTVASASRRRRDSTVQNCTVGHPVPRGYDNTVEVEPQPTWEAYRRVDLVSARQDSSTDGGCSGDGV